MATSSAPVIACRVAGVVLVLVTILLWAPGPGEQVEMYSLHTDGHCEWQSRSTCSFGLLRYYETSSAQREGGPVVEHSATHGGRLAATVLLTGVSLGAALGLWMIARQPRSRQSA